MGRVLTAASNYNYSWSHDKDERESRVWMREKASACVRTEAIYVGRGKRIRAIAKWADDGLKVKQAEVRPDWHQVSWLLTRWTLIGSLCVRGTSTCESLRNVPPPSVAGKGSKRREACDMWSTTSRSSPYDQDRNTTHLTWDHELQPRICCIVRRPFWGWENGREETEERETSKSEWGLQDGRMH
jgi:hypothetical protein